MLATCLLLLAVTIASVTDIRRHTIYNWTTYPGIVVALLFNALGGLLPGDEVWRRDALGVIGIEESLKGFGLCGGLLFACFVLFNIGGGDVKLLAMAGAFLGVENGLEVLLWTFVFGAVAGITRLIWRAGVPWLVKRVFVVCWNWLRWRIPPTLTPEEREMLGWSWPLYLAPCVGVAVITVKSGWVPNM